VWPANDNRQSDGGWGDLMAKLQRFSAVTKEGRCPLCGYAVLRNANPILGGKGLFAARMSHVQGSLKMRRLLQKLGAESPHSATTGPVDALIRTAQSLVLRTVCSVRSNQIKCGRCGVRYLRD
jgi:hypothetical protein